MLTGIKDSDYKILNELEDKDLVSVCQTNKTASKICDDQTFWFNQILTKFPKVSSETFLKNKKGRSWSEYYIEDLRNIDLTQPNKLLVDGARNGREDWVMIALGEGVDIHTWNDAALRWASMGGHVEVVKILMEAGADIHGSDYIGYDAALRLASQNKHVEVVKLLKQYY